MFHMKQFCLPKLAPDVLPLLINLIRKKISDEQFLPNGLRIKEVLPGFTEELDCRTANFFLFTILTG